ncbi:MAG: DUF167 domain-containing protein [Syntrophaceae bacterium]|nr:DUF167 domain-containing protein [Syntrophaceae bacterium]
MNPPIIRQTKKGLEIRIKVTPNSSQESISYKDGEALIVKLKSPPVDGKANKELVRILSKKLRISQSEVQITRGFNSREKTLLVQGINETQAADLLQII